MGGVPYKIAPVEQGEYKGQELFTVNTDFWETDLQARLDERLPGEPESLSMFAGAEHDEELLVHLCNGTLADKIDARGNARLLWIKKNESDPNDYRDAIRYGLALAMAYVAENDGYPPRSDTGTKAKAVLNHGQKRPDGRKWNE